MYVIGLTGGIASGKSTIGRRLAELGAVRLDADQLARDAVALGSPGLARVRDRFGDEMISEDGTLDRAGLGAVVFADAEALADLNAIVHPEVQRLFRERIAEIEARDPGSIVVYEVPLLAESGVSGAFDLVVVADAPAELRVQRLGQFRGMSEEDARRRIANQASDAERRSVADVVIDTSGTVSETLAQVDAFWESLPRRMGEHSPSESAR